MTLPNVTNDEVIQASQRLGLKHTESLFYRYAVSTGYRGKGAEERAKALDTLWKRHGYVVLPNGLKDFILEICATPHVELEPEVLNALEGAD